MQLRKRKDAPGCGALAPASWSPPPAPAILALVVAFPPIFCRPCHPPRGAGGRNNSGGVQRGMSELLFSRIAAFWDPGAAQVGHFRDLSWVCFPFLSLCGFKPQTIPHFSPSIPGACRYCHNKNHQLSGKFSIQSRQSLVPVTSASAAGTPGSAELLL